MGSGNSKEEEEEEEAQQFLGLYNAYMARQIPKSDDTAGNFLPGFRLPYGEDNWSYEFIQNMREGGVNAAMEMVKKQPVLIGNLNLECPNSVNGILGITFEELQIAKIMAEVKRRQCPIDLIAGDGKEPFTVDGHNLRSPEYTDAVFHNTTTDEYFAIQIKCSNTPENLVKMMKKWYATHQNKPGQPHLPEELNLENVQRIGLSDVVNGMSGAEFQDKIKLGFEMRPENYKKVQQVLDDNKQILKRAVNDERYTQTFDELKKHTNAIKTLSKKLAKQTNLKENVGRTVSGEDNIQRRSDELDKIVEGINEKMSIHDNEIKNIDEYLKADLKKI